MSEQQDSGPGLAGPTGGDWWARRPRRSMVDRKIAGVAGGLGRALGVDPVLVRVVLVVLTVFGGIGALLYLLGWLLLPSDGDEVSALESLLGRGQSSVPPVVTVGLAVVAAVAATGVVSWGIPFWVVPVAIVAVVVFARRRAGISGHRGGCGGGTPPWVRDLHRQGRVWGDQATAWVDQQDWGKQARDWVQQQPWTSRTGVDRSTESTAGAPEGAEKVSLRKDPADAAADTAADRGHAGAPADPDAPRQPPAWDPLGAAPFAWDLPEPTPTPAPVAPRRDRAVLARVTIGVALISGAVATAGVFAGWWPLSWAAVTAIPLTVVAVGVLVGSLVWRRGRIAPLVGPGIFLALLTAGLAMTGLTGTDGYGQQTWRPTSVEQLQSDYLVNGGQGVLDLTALTVPAGERPSVDVTVRAGHAEVILPEGMAVTGSCHANAGEVTCLGTTQQGLDSTVDFATNSASSDAGSLDLTVTVGAGQAEVRRG